MFYLVSPDLKLAYLELVLQPCCEDEQNSIFIIKILKIQILIKSDLKKKKKKKKKERELY